MRSAEIEVEVVGTGTERGVIIMVAETTIDGITVIGDNTISTTQEIRRGLAKGRGGEEPNMTSLSIQVSKKY